MVPSCRYFFGKNCQFIGRQTPDKLYCCTSKLHKTCNWVSHHLNYFLYIYNINLVIYTIYDLFTHWIKVYYIFSCYYNNLFLYADTFSVLELMLVDILPGQHLIPLNFTVAFPTDLGLFLLILMIISNVYQNGLLDGTNGFSQETRISRCRARPRKTMVWDNHANVKNYWKIKYIVLY